MLKQKVKKKKKRKKEKEKSYVSLWELLYLLNLVFLTFKPLAGWGKTHSCTLFFANLEPKPFSKPSFSSSMISCPSVP